MSNKLNAFITAFSELMPVTRPPWLVIVALFAGMLSGIPAAQADIIGTEGADPVNNVEVKVWGPPPPPDVRHGGLWGEYPENRWSWVFEENSDMMLPTDISVDITAPGNYRYDPLTPGIVAAGTLVQSYLIHFDHDGPTRGSSGGIVTFDSDILGVIVNPGYLDSTDALLGAPGTMYPGTMLGSEPYRGVEFEAGGNDDTVIVSDDRRSIEVFFWVWGPPETFGPDTDQVRVLTAVPAPGRVPFTCNNQAFVTRDPRLEGPIDPDVILPPGPKDNYLYVVDLSAWPSDIGFDAIKRLESPAGTPIVVNPVGFRRTDGLLYGWRRGPRPREMVQIDATGTVFPLGDAGLPDEAFVAGDIKPDGSEMYFVCVGTITDPLMLYTVPLTDAGPGDAMPPVDITLGENSEDLSIEDPGDNVSDWAMSPFDGLLYGADREGDLAILDPATGERTDRWVEDLPIGKGYGAAWFNAAGRLFLYWNEGEVIEVDVAVPRIEERLAQSSSKRNDGAACIF